MKRNQMLDAAYRIFIREGIQDLRMRALACKIGITKQEMQRLRQLKETRAEDE